MPVVALDHVDVLEMREVNGVIRSLTRRARVTGLPTGTDYTSLYTAMTQVGIPNQGTWLTTIPKDRSSPFGMLVLAERKVNIDRMDPGCADIDLMYQHFMDGDNQDLSIAFSNPALAGGVVSIHGRMKTSVQQVKTNFYSELQATPLSPTPTTFETIDENSVFDWVASVDPGTGLQTINFQVGDLVRFNNVAYRTLVVRGPTSPAPPNPSSAWELIPEAPEPYDNTLTYGRGAYVTSGGATYRSTTIVPPDTIPPNASFWAVSNPADIPEWEDTAHESQSFPIGLLVRYRGIIFRTARDVGAGSPAPVPGLDWTIAVENVHFRFIPGSERTQRVIHVGHRFPINDQQVAGQVFWQSGEVTKMQPQRNYEIRGTIYTPRPWQTANAIIAKINSTGWMDGAPFEWMCTEVAWEALIIGTKYKFRFEFQHNPDTWVPTAIFVDQRFGRPPSDLVSGFGYRHIRVHDELDYDTFFQTSLEGWTILEAA